jgi:hypothetical protein
LAVMDFAAVAVTPVDKLGGKWQNMVLAIKDSEQEWQNVGELTPEDARSRMLNSELEGSGAVARSVQRTDTNFVKMFEVLVWPQQQLQQAAAAPGSSSTTTTAPQPKWMYVHLVPSIMLIKAAAQRIVKQGNGGKLRIAIDTAAAAAAAVAAPSAAAAVAAASAAAAAAASAAAAAAAAAAAVAASPQYRHQLQPVSSSGAASVGRRGAGASPHARLTCSPHAGSGINAAKSPSTPTTILLNALASAATSTPSRNLTIVAVPPRSFNKLVADYSMEEIGQAGNAYVGRLTTSNGPLVIKSVPLMASNSKGTQGNLALLKAASMVLESEYAAVMDCRHRHVVNLLGVTNASFNQPGWVGPRRVLVFEYCSEGDLGNVGSEITLREIVSCLLNVAQGLEHVHSLEWIHCDMKPENMLMDRPDTLGLVGKLADFGEARYLTNKAQHYLGEAGQPLLGTVGYTAPELVATRHSIQPRYTKAADMYSFGVSMWVILSNSVPETVADIVSGDPEVNAAK